MVGIFFLLTIIYYSSLFTFFLLFYVFKSVFQITSNSPKIIYQSLIRHYLPKNIIYLIILQFIGMIPSFMFYIKYCLLAHAPLIKYSYGVIFLFLNLLVSIFFYLQFFKKWNTFTAQECRYISFFRKINTSEDFEPYNYYGNDFKKRYLVAFFIITFLLINFLAPFYFTDVFFLLFSVVF